MQVHRARLRMNLARRLMTIGTRKGCAYNREGVCVCVCVWRESV